MSKKIVYSKGFDGVSDFVYVDLLPDVKRSRQFNMNVIIALTFAVVLSFVLIYMPFRTATEDFETLNGTNNDLKHELLLTNEELIGYEINLETITFEQQIEMLVVYRIDFNMLLGELRSLVEAKNVSNYTVITHIEYDSTLGSFQLVVESTLKDNFLKLNNDFFGLTWVSNSTYISPPEALFGGTLHRSTFTIGVDLDAE